MPDEDISAQVRGLVEPQIAIMRDRGIPKEEAVKRSGQPYEVVDRIYNASKPEKKTQQRRARNRTERGE